MNRMHGDYLSRSHAREGFKEPFLVQSHDPFFTIVLEHYTRSDQRLTTLRKRPFKPRK